MNNLPHPDGGYWIVNPNTRNILGEPKTFGSSNSEGLPYTVYCQGAGENNSGFFALLGCPNGSGIVRMLTDHCNTLGHKTISSIRVLNPRDYMKRTSGSRPSNIVVYAVTDPRSGPATDPSLYIYIHRIRNYKPARW